MTQDNLIFKRQAFVGRKKEVERVREILQQIKEGSASQQPKSIVFQGEMGIGKSWLLRYLYNDFIADIDLKTVYCDLKQYAGQDPPQAVMEIIKLFIPEDDSVASVESLAQASLAVMEKIQDTLKDKLLVIVADHVYESDWKLLSELENHLFGPVAIEPRTFFILAGRGREYPWKTPELRLRAEFIDLQPFTKEETKNQMKNISAAAERNYEATYEISKGVPLLNFLLTEKSKEKFEQAINYTLETVAHSERKQIRSYLEALSVLRYFDEERIPVMLKAYDPNNKIGNEYAEASKVRDELVRASFAHWDDEKGGFVMDKSLQGVLGTYLELYDNPRWTKLHHEAAALYQAWKLQYRTASKYWEEEIKHHKGVLAGKNKNSRPSRA